ncbi:MAG: hypothetical protein V3U87_12100 [Methylococcaceae bacterium]
MKKIILTIVLSSFLPAIAIAEDKKMQNSNPNAADSVVTGKHMQNSNPNAEDSVMKGKHMMNDNPYSSHPKDNARVENKSDRGYTVIKYEE